MVKRLRRRDALFLFFYFLTFSADCVSRLIAEAVFFIYFCGLVVLFFVALDVDASRCFYPPQFFKGTRRNSTPRVLPSPPMSYPQGYLYQPPGSLALYSCPAYGASALAAPRSEELARSSSGSAFSPYPGSAAFSASAGAGFSSALQYTTDPTTGFPSYMVRNRVAAVVVMLCCFVLCVYVIVVVLNPGVPSSALSHSGRRGWAGGKGVGVHA